MNYKSILILLIAVFLLFSCSKNGGPVEINANQQGENEKEKVKSNENEENNEIEEKTDVEDDKDDKKGMEFLEETPAVPVDTAGFINQKPGPYASIDVRDDSIAEDVKEDVRRLEALSKDASEAKLDEYFNYMYSLVAEDFPDPQDTIKKWEFGASGNPDLPDSRYHFKENYNIEVLLDASGSMGAYIGDKTMMQIAKEAIHNFMKQVPDEANISFRVYGHVGTGSQSDKEKSCAAIEQVYGYGSYDEAEFQAELEKIEPAGWTPLADALKQAEKSLEKYDTEHNTNLIYVVSDGVETCDGDPVEVANSLSDSNAQPIINIIGFNVDNEAKAQLQKMAELSGGIFSTANDQEQLENEFNRAEEVLKAWEEWKEEALQDAEYTRVENSFDILGVTNEWSKKDDFLIVNLSTLTYIFEEEGIIDFQQVSYFESKRNKVNKLLKEARKDVKEELEDISVEKLEEMKRNIEEKYSNQSTR
ncbi:VWA domain-containing protein [Virgibacillus sp. C22-A2]|uniref:VWA domain-containing protein n=1 Tax=Virgibacillus tibetensis TaxID=3042313 RepID=A0ABU6KI05_9BACI|nr:VWA domain-containing protein [Virgibacillus sp. C22-A2]